MITVGEIRKWRTGRVAAIAIQQRVRMPFPSGGKHRHGLFLETNSRSFVIRHSCFQALVPLIENLKSDASPS